MTHQFPVDLRCARRNAGLTQADCGHLLGIDASTLKTLEGGKREPSLREILTLSLIFGRSFESFFSELLKDVRAELSERLATLPASEEHASTFNRKTTLEKLEQRLAEEFAADHEG
ncbi:helix-turn-helix transcriptional regulator [Aquicoccus porphyridii]|uniref:Helix-turn-helix transcriptional regulator n=1 Tax=Aquicoccus porphyridii TaxID=1852029 RepID=A0A5A9YXI3_9RHOB|nr:helix-turn-helix transcriptional regulator [Aquicoccus porphyridii]KAA0909539.1 helix-turn-helix transcriptional regulator [Aquicoccus porphyridii]RAI51816.1 hypothetical protein DOO74_21255 [Rhodobacteraceae bacterium AsT-22]